ncbi:MAG: type III-B CRISPR module RAMP protein Cmr1 [Crenarchaeota archaeon]|nr:type III-B CRISPR module RAMP protein Cmr1 [Thermoproteota archaeon]
MSTLLELELKNNIASFIGGFDAQSHSWDPFRTQSLKGLWRWWLRAYIMGVLHDKGLLTFKTGKARLVELSRESIFMIQKLTGRLLGSTENASRFRIIAIVQGTPRERYCPSSDKVCRYQRVRLLTVGGRRVSYLPNLPTVTVRSIISERLSKREQLGREEIYLGIGTLLTGLVLNGLGKMSRRGVGTFSIRLINDSIRMFYKYFSRDGTFNYDRLPELVKETLNYCEKYVNNIVRESSQKVSELPPCDVISRNQVQLSQVLDSKIISKDILDSRKNVLPVFSIYELRWSSKNVEDVCRELQDFFYRPERIRKYYGGPNTPYGHWQDIITVRKYAWILGLPREQRGTGYIVHGIDRRASPIHVSVHRDRAFVTCFISLDWPRRIEWAGRSSIVIEVDENRILEAFVIVLSYFEKYLGKLGYTYRVIFP